MQHFASMAMKHKRLNGWMPFFLMLTDITATVTRLKKAIETTAGLMPQAFLNRVFQGTEEQQKACDALFFHSVTVEFGVARFSKIDVTDLICVVPTTEHTGDLGLGRFGHHALGKGGCQRKWLFLKRHLQLRFFEAAPDPEPVLHAYADRCNTFRMDRKPCPIRCNQELMPLQNSFSACEARYI